LAKGALCYSPMIPKSNLIISGTFLEESCNNNVLKAYLNGIYMYIFNDLHVWLNLTYEIPDFDFKTIKYVFLVFRQKC